jgi:hypothetical protein
MTLAISRPAAVGRRRLSALITPVVSDWSSPNGLPMAKAACPTLRSVDEPTAIGPGRLANPLTRITAMS